MQRQLTRLVINPWKQQNDFPTYWETLFAASLSREYLQ